MRFGSLGFLGWLFHNRTYAIFHVLPHQGYANGLIHRYTQTNPMLAVCLLAIIRGVQMLRNPQYARALSLPIAFANAHCYCVAFLRLNAVYLPLQSLRWHCGCFGLCLWLDLGHLMHHQLPCRYRCKSGCFHGCLIDQSLNSDFRVPQWCHLCRFHLDCLNE